jgi:hypothetical protein
MREAMSRRSIPQQEVLAMTHVSRILRLSLPALALVLAACSDTRSEQPKGAAGGSASATYQGAGTGAGANIDRAGPGGPSDPLGVLPQDVFAPGSNSRGPNIDLDQ